MSKGISTVAFAVGGLCCALPAFGAAAEPTINVGTFNLLPNTSNQTIPIYVTGAVGGTAVQGIDLYAETGDGGVAVGGTAGPVISAVNLKPAGGVFGNITDVPTDPGSEPQVAVRDLAYISGGSGASINIPNSSTLLLDLTIDTTGILTGTYKLDLANVLSAYNTDFGSVPINITNGSINVTAVTVPEPASLGCVALSGLFLLRRKRQR